MRQRAVISLPFSVIAHGGGVAQRAVINTPSGAPFSVTFGPPDGSLAGETLTVPYSSSHPLVRAWLALAGRRQLDVEIRAALLAVDLPGDAPDGLATLYVADALGREASTTFSISGVLAPPTPVIPRVGGLPFAPEIKRSRSTCGSRSRYRVATTTRSSARARSRQAYGVTAVGTTLTSASASSRSLVTARVLKHTTSVATAVASEVIRRRAEGPVAEEELLLLL